MCCGGVTNTVVCIFLVFIVGTLEAYLVFGSRADCVIRCTKSHVLAPSLRYAAVKQLCVQQRTSAELTISSLLVIQDCISAMEGAICMHNTVLRYAFYPSRLSIAAQRRSSSPCVCAERGLHMFISPFSALVIQ